MGILKIAISVFCECKPETIEQLFRYCDRIFPLQSALTNWIGEVTKIKVHVEFCIESVLLGYTNCLPCKNAITCIILVVRFFISKCKMKGHNPHFAGVQSYLKFQYNIKTPACDFSHQGKFLHVSNIIILIYIVHFL